MASGKAAINEPKHFVGDGRRTCWWEGLGRWVWLRTIGERLVTSRSQEYEYRAGLDATRIYGEAVVLNSKMVVMVLRKGRLYSVHLFG